MHVVTIFVLYAGVYSQGLTYGGPVVLVWGWVCAGMLHTLVGLAMSELASAFPVSGGLYFWSFMLAQKHGAFASWIVGWINLLGAHHKQIAGMHVLTSCQMHDRACGRLLHTRLLIVVHVAHGSGYCTQLYMQQIWQNPDFWLSQ